jgi:hypothetical protein
MKPRFFLAGILFLATSLGLAALDKETAKKDDPLPKPAAEKASKRPLKAAQGELTCTLNFAWWDEPPLAEGDSIELAIQAEKTTTPIYPSAMRIGANINYSGPATINIVRKTKTQVEEVDKKGKPVIRTVENWVPFATCAVAPGQSDVLIVLILVPGKPVAMAKPFDINPENFPYGSFHILNFSKARVGCSLGGKVFFAEPGQRAKSPLVMTQRTVVNFRLAVFETGGDQQRLYSAPIILDERTRRLYFVTEVAGNDIAQRYDTRTLVDYRRLQLAAAEEPTPEKPEPKATKASTKAAPKSEK